jgi:O-antigen/teichoic acid export membrane protein
MAEALESVVRVPAVDGSIRSRVLHGLAWKAGGQLVMQASRVVVAIVLARLLAPHDFGVAAMVLVFTSLVLVVSDVALGAALVQRPLLTERDCSTAFWATVGLGALFTGMGIAVSGAVASFYGEPQVRPLMAALSVGFLVNALGVTQEALLVREMRFRSLELRAMASVGVGAVVGIGAASAGWGAWAIIGQQLALGATSTLLLWRFCPWRPGFRFSRASLRDLGGFSANIFGHRVLYYLHRNADNLLVGRFLGAAALGAYALAYNVMLLPFSRIAGPVQDVLFPAFSKLQDEPGRIAELWMRATRVIGAISVPALAGLVVVAPDVVQVVLGPRWSGMVPVLQILAWVGLLQSLQTLNTNILQALDRTRTLLRFSVVFFATHLAAFAIGLQWGIVGVAAGYAVSSTIVEPVFAWVTCRVAGTTVRAFAASLAGVAAASLVMAVCVLGLRVLLVHEGVPAALRLLLLAVAGAVVYLPACAWRAPEVVTELRRLRPPRRDRSSSMPGGRTGRRFERAEGPAPRNTDLGGQIPVPLIVRNRPGSDPRDAR